MSVGKLFELRLPVTVTLVVAAGVLALSVLFHLISGSWEKTGLFFAGAVAAGGTLSLAFYTARTLVHFINHEMRVHERDTTLDDFHRKERALILWQSLE